MEIKFFNKPVHLCAISKVNKHIAVAVINRLFYPHTVAFYLPIFSYCIRF